MALRLRCRRALSLINQSLHHQQKSASVFPSVSHLLPAAGAATLSSTTRLTLRPFTSTTSLFMSYRGKTFDPETDEIGPDTVLFEGCDYNHWLITIDFPKDANLSREQMIETYINTAAQVFGSVEEAKKKIYALSTTTYQGFQVECTEETSEKFKGLPGVVFVLPDSYIDPVNKEYGGDKYVNGEIFPRPPPVHYGRRNYGDRRPREQSSYQQGAQQNYDASRQQNYGPPPPRQQNYGPPQPQQNYTPPQQQNYAPPPQQNYGPPPQQNYGPPPQQNYGPPPQQNYGQPPQQNFGNPPRENQQQNYVPPNQQIYGQPQNFPPQQNYSSPGLGGRRGPMPNAPEGGGANPMPSYGGNFNPGGDAGNQYAQGQRDNNFGAPQRGEFGQVSEEQRNFSYVRKN